MKSQQEMTRTILFWIGYLSLITGILLAASLGWALIVLGVTIIIFMLLIYADEQAGKVLDGDYEE